jgi:RNA polymerase sigma-70 factor (ECF subfamily)
MGEDRTAESPTRPSLLLRLRDPHDRESWATFVEVYGPLTYRHCRRRGLRHEDAEDVTQEVFTRIGAAIRTFEYRPDLGGFRHWLGTLVRNEVYRFLKRTRPGTAGRGGDDSDDVLNEVAARGEDTLWAEEFNAHVLQTALARSRAHFDAQTWRAFERTWRDNRPAPEVARELGRAIDWVYVAKCRVLKRLWQEVQELADDTILLALSPSVHG